MEYNNIIETEGLDHVENRRYNDKKKKCRREIDRGANGSIEKVIIYDID